MYDLLIETPEIDLTSGGFLVTIQAFSPIEHSEQPFIENVKSQVGTLLRPYIKAVIKNVKQIDPWVTGGLLPMYKYDAFALRQLTNLGIKSIYKRLNQLEREYPDNIEFRAPGKGWGVEESWESTAALVGLQVRVNPRGRPKRHK